MDLSILSLALFPVALPLLSSGSQSPEIRLPPENRKFYRIQINDSPIDLSEGVSKLPENCHVRL